MTRNLKKWYPTYRDWLLAPIYYLNKSGKFTKLSIGKEGKFLISKSSHR